MSVRLAAALRPWAGPFVCSLTVHAAIAATAIGLGAVTEPPRSEATIAVDLVFEVAPESPPESPRSPMADTVPAPSAPPVPPAMAPPPPEPPPPVPPSQPLPARPAAAESVAPRPVAPQPRPAIQAAAPLPQPKPLPPPALVAELADAAADKAPPPPERVEPGIARMPLPPSVPAVDEGGPAPERPERQAARGDPGPALMPPRWGDARLANPPPAYPLTARRQGVEGRVVLRVRVDEQGRADSVVIATGSGHGLLDEAARRAVSRWRFVPARQAGVAVPASVDVSIVFRLKD